jgi:hypothetical protein
MQDTRAVALDRYYDLLRAQPAYQRLAQAVALSRTVRELCIAGIRQRHPGASEQEIRVRLAVRLYGRSVGERLFGQVPADAV